MTMKNIVKIYVPSTFNIDQKIDNADEVKRIERFLAKRFGGCTSTKASGSWLSESEEIVSEEITIVYSFCTLKQLYNYKSEVIKECEKLCKRMNQEAISLEINNKLYFIGQSVTA